MSSPALPPFSPSALLACVGAALDAIGVGLAVCGRDGAPCFANETVGAEADALCRRLARDAAPVEAGAPGERVASAMRLSDDAALVVIRREAAPMPTATGGTHGLSRREVEVARLLARRYSNREVAAALSISVHTARHHAERVFHKLGVRTRADVAAALAGRAVSAR